MTPAALLPAVFVLVGTAFAQRAPTISYISQEQIKDIGDTVELQCSVQYAQDCPVLWVKVDPNRLVDPLYISTGTSLTFPDNRFALRYDEASSTYTLQITDIRETDNGTYQCVVKLDKSTKIYAEVEMLVRTPPLILSNSTSTVTVTEGVSIQLQCYAEGYPPPQISWRRENNVLFHSGSSSLSGSILDIKNITKDDRGVYFCVAENGVGKKKKHSIEVNVEFAPITSAPRPRVGQALHYNADLDCNVESYPNPAIYWLKNGTMLYSSAKHMTSAFSTPNGHVSSVLRIINVEPADYGIYTCNAANELGSSHVLVEFFETTDPVCPPACSVRSVSEVFGSTKNATSDKEHRQT